MHQHVIFIAVQKKGASETNDERLVRLAAVRNTIGMTTPGDFNHGEEAPVKVEEIKVGVTDA